jgi:predicted RND superfamily exporter protein
MKLDHFFKKLATFLNRRALSVSAFFLVVFLLSTFFTVKLYGSLKTDIEEMLPTTSRSVIDLKEVTKRLRAIDNLAVLIFSKNSEAAGRFQQDLANELQKIPSKLSSGIEYKITDEVDFFKKRKALFITKEDLDEIQSFIKKKIEYEKFIYNPINLVIENKPNEPKFSFNELEKKYSSKSDAFSHFPGGIYATPDGTNRLILVYAPDAQIATAHGLKDAVAEIVAKMDPKKYSPDLEVKYSSSIQDLLEEEASLMKDLILSTLVVSFLVALVLLVYYRSFFATMALIFSLLVGTIITLGVSYFLVGDLNANSAFLGSIIMGNGINFGIMVLARYLEERRSRKQEHEIALQISMRETVLPTFAAALAAAISYGSLMLTSFRGFSQFGVIGFVGMVSCWFCAYTFFPAALSLLNRYVSIAGSERRTESRSLWAYGLKKLLIKIPKPMAILGVIITIIAAIGLSQIDKTIIETDLTKLRDKTSMEEGSGFLSQYVELILKRNTTPIAVMTHNQEDAEKIAHRLMEKKTQEGEKSMIGSVMRIQDFVPTQQEEKIRSLRAIQEQLPPKIFWSLPETDKARVKDFLSTETLKPFTMADLPPKLLDRFREKDGSVGNLVLVEPPLTDEIRQGESLLRFVKSIRDVVDEIEPNAPVAGRLPVSADMLSAVLKDGPIATAASAIAVIILTIFLFRSVELSLLVLSALFIGVAWMVAGMHFFHLKINFLNFIALPITFGIGVDYAVNVFHRYREEKEKAEHDRQNGVADVKDQAGDSPIIRAVYHTGGAVVLASMTTTIGWSSLMIAGNQAFVSFGRIAMIGEATCVTVAVLIIPSVLIWLQGRRKPE